MQKKMEQMGDLIKRLKLCVRWFKRVEEGYIQEKEKLQTELESAEKKCVDTGEFSLSALLEAATAALIIITFFLMEL